MTRCSMLSSEALQLLAPLPLPCLLSSDINRQGRPVPKYLPDSLWLSRQAGSVELAGAVYLRQVKKHANF